MRGVKPIARRLWRGNLLVSLFAGLLFLIKILARKPVYTGDEPRYLHMAYSFLKPVLFILPTRNGWHFATVFISAYILLSC